MNLWCLQIGKWEACVQDCKELLRESQENEEVAKMMKEAKAKISSRGLVLVSSNEHFRDSVASPGDFSSLFFALFRLNFLNSKAWISFLVFVFV